MIAYSRRVGGGAPLPLDRQDLILAAESALALAGRSGEDLELVVVNDLEMERLNREFSGCVGPTNVLSFPLEDGSGLGVVVLSLDTLWREALLYGQDSAEHGLRLLAHGVFHLCGLPHGDAMDALTDAAVETALSTMA